MHPKNVMSLLSLATLASVGLGCTGSGVSLRPDGSPGPEKCSEEALKTMRILRLEPGEGAFVEIDANQTGDSPLTLMDGPIESFTREDLKTLPTTTRLYGQVWTGGPTVVIRYYEARPPGGDRIPICAVARSGPNEMNVLRKLPSSRPGVAVLKHSQAAAWIVDDFR
jgi:hypothetical protein